MDVVTTPESVARIVERTAPFSRASSLALFYDRGGVLPVADMQRKKSPSPAIAAAMYCR